MQSIAELNRQFGIPGIAEVVSGDGGIAVVRVTHGGVAGAMYLHGAHVTHWRPAGGEEVLWMSQKSMWQADKPIRGGVPICFPWFGPLAGVPTAPAHGFVRAITWELETITQSSGGVTVTMKLASDASTMARWPHEFVLRHRVTFGSMLSMSLELTNPGKTPLKAEQALHTYFSVRDVRLVAVKGLNGVRYIDKVDERKEKMQSGDIQITGETDRVYLNTTGAVTIEDPGMGRRIIVGKESSRNTVVWNPWIAKAKAMADFGDQEWPGMICVETCNVGADAVEVAPGGTHFMRAQIATASLA